MKITITSRLELSGVPDALSENIRKNLEFPNPRWLDNDRMGRWNRDTPKFLRFYEEIRSETLYLPRGFARQLILMCRNHHVDYTLEDRRRTLPEADFSFSGSLRPFQQAAADKMLSREFGTLNAPTGSGKTVIALYMIARRRQPALVVVHTKDLALQWVARISTFLGIPADQVGFIGGGKREVGEKITVALVQSLCKCAETVAPKIGYIVVDECHRAPSRTFTDAVSAFDARYMLGLTATPWRRDRLSRLIFWYLGDVHYQIDKTGLIEKGHILEVEVVIRETAFRPFYDPVREYSKMLSELTADDERNRLITADVSAEAGKGTGVCLVLSDRKKHCETLQALLKYNYKISAGLLTGDLSTRKRQEVLDRLTRGELTVLVATGQLIGEGFDCKDLSTLFIATPVKFSGRLVQYLGRVLRPAPGKTRARVYDYVDVQVGPLVAAAINRQQVYQAQGARPASRNSEQ
ncbi:ATP-dependent helicase [Desulfonema ishimotonii]|uniref:ATP-dependent helicase n=1 Tax=Desulfonema ishimotonii TaxID=45657 RepID=A0A401FV14_9BACT|nr:DEAD/DEAH box helicase [Desulfonema ishimotonii]GBC60784.1 ATP-dependent helicase [Desulfonema ishimotonii]